MLTTPIDPLTGPQYALQGRVVTMDGAYTVLDAGTIYIDAGISPDDMVVLVGQDRLRDGQEVHVTHIEGPTP